MQDGTEALAAGDAARRRGPRVQSPGLPVRAGVVAVRAVRITDDPEILERVLAGLLGLAEGPTCSPPAPDATV